ncbi:MAG: trimethylamine methyltransferase family protein [Anaerolineae bacterium]
MDKRFDPIRLFSEDELERLHQASLDILADPGMKILAPSLLRALREAGAQVDEARSVVRFPRELVERSLEGIRREIQAGRKQKILNGVVASKSAWPVQAKFSGACIEYWDWEAQAIRPPTRRDLVDLVRLGQALPEVATVGNPVTYLAEDDGTPVDPRMQRVKTAALIARYTTKAGPTEVWNTTELRYQMALGELVRGSREAYLAEPCFVTAKETISPLTLDADAGEVLLALAREGLPATIIPMPITGASAPMSLAANIALGNAEIIGVMAAVRAACPDAVVGGGIISGILDMATGQAVYAAPEAVLQDVGTAELHERRYGFDFGIGGYTDAKYPGAQSVLEKLERFWMIARTGRVNFPVGLINYGRAFSPEQALVDIEIAHMVEQVSRGIEVSADTLCLEDIRAVGIGGTFLGEERTLTEMRRAVWYPRIMDRASSLGLSQDKARDMLDAAAARKQAVLAKAGYEIDADRSREIDKILQAAEKELTR